MNEHLEYNLHLRDAIVKNRFGKKFEELVGADVLGFRCVTCGGVVSSRTVEFYRHDVNRFRCYDCQNKNKYEI